MKITIEFNEDNIKELAEREKKITHPKLLLRIHIIQMIACRIPNTTIQEIKKVSHDSFRKFRKAYSE